jgi:hypothetical protein
MSLSCSQYAMLALNIPAGNPATIKLTHYPQLRRPIAGPDRVAGAPGISGLSGAGRSRAPQGLPAWLGRRCLESPGSDETVSLGREVGRKRVAAITCPDQTTRFGHGGIHHQLVLPPVSQEISGSHAKAVSAVGLMPMLILSEKTTPPPRRKQIFDDSADEQADQQEGDDRWIKQLIEKLAGVLRRIGKRK